MLLSLLVLLAQTAASLADVPATIEGHLGLRRVTAVEISPDGRSVAFVVEGADVDADHHRSALYSWEPRTGSQPLAPAFSDVRAPQWSPDGEWLVFIATNPTATEDDAIDQLWALPRFSESPLHLSEIAGRIIDFGWSENGSLLVLVEDEPGEPRGFWRLRIAEGEAEQIWDGDPGIREMAVSPDGRTIAYASNGSAAPENFLNYDIWVLDIEGASARRLTTRAGPEVSPVWTPDGSGVVFRAPQSTSRIHSQTELFRVSATGGAPQLLTGAFDRSVIDHVWPAAGDLMFTAAVGTYTHLFELQISGAIEQVLGGAYNFGPFDARGVGTTVFAVRESTTEAPELWRLGIEETERLTQLNSHIDGWRLGRQSVIQWTAPDGMAIEGILVLPTDFIEGDRYPLLVNPSRGEGMRVRNVLASYENYQPIAAQGYAVLTANVRGSIGYGEGFLTASRNDLAGGEFADLVAGIDYVIDLGVADSTRLAIFGDDYSGYSAMRAITQTRRFSAAAASFGVQVSPESGAVESDLTVSLSGTAGLEGFGYEDSPLRQTEHVRTPLLIIDAGDEASALADRARQMYRSLTDLGRVAAYVGHEDLAESDRQREADVFFRQLRWFDRYLKFAGADIIEFYRVGEWVSGPRGWQMRVRRVLPGASYLGSEPRDGRYLEVTLEFQPGSDSRSDAPLQLDPTAAISLVDPNGAQTRPAGSVARLIGSEILIRDSTSLTGESPNQSATMLSLRLAFEVPARAAEYYLRAAGFAPIRIWVPGSGQ